MSRFIDTVRRELRHALRTLRKKPGFSALVILSLALGIGVNTTMFSVVNAVLLRSVPFPDADRLVRLVQSQTGGDVTMAEFEHVGTRPCIRVDRRVPRRRRAAARRGGHPDLGRVAHGERRFPAHARKAAQPRPRVHGRRDARRRSAGGRHQRQPLAVDVRRRPAGPGPLGQRDRGAQVVAGLEPVGDRVRIGRFQGKDFLKDASREVIGV